MSQLRLTASAIFQMRLQKRLQGQRVGEKERRKKSFSLTIVTDLNLMVKH